MSHVADYESHYAMRWCSRVKRRFYMMALFVCSSVYSSVYPPEWTTLSCGYVLRRRKTGPSWCLSLRAGGVSSRRREWQQCNPRGVDW